MDIHSRVINAVAKHEWMDLEWRQEIRNVPAKTIEEIWRRAKQAEFQAGWPGEEWLS